MKKRYIIEKRAEPEEISADYAASLDTLEGEETDLTDSLDVILKAREMTDEEVEKVRARGHIVEVFVDEDIFADEEITTDARTASMADVALYHGFVEAHAAGYRGQGRKIAVIDTGLSRAWEGRIAGRIFARRSFVPGESHEDHTSGHGTHVMGTVVHNAPGALYGVYKNLSTETGAGSASYGILATNQAVKDGATDINQSYGGDGNENSPASLANDAARRAGVRVNTASGNAQRGTTALTSDARSPASSRLGCTVGSGDIDGRLSDFSSWGKCVDIRAVGEAQTSWAVGGGYATMSGTSMASPVVTAAGAVCGSKGASADEIDKALYSSTGDTRYSPAQEGHGILDVEFAVKKLTPKSKPGKPPSAPEKSYFPDLPRVARWQFSKKVVPSELRDCVLTLDGEDIGRFTPKEG